MGRLYKKYIDKFLIINLISLPSGYKDLRGENRILTQVIYLES